MIISESSWSAISMDTLIIIRMLVGPKADSTVMFSTFRSRVGMIAIIIRKSAPNIVRRLHFFWR